MLSKERLKAIGVIVTAVAFFGGLLYTGIAGAVAASFSDPAGDTQPAGTGGIDIVSVSHDDDGNSFTYRVDTAAPFDNNLFTKIEWDLSLDNDATLRESSDACITVEGNGSGGLIAALSDCGSEIISTVTATKTTQGTGERVEVVFPNAVIRNAAPGGLGTGTAYQYKVVSDVFGETDSAPDTGLVAHTALTPEATPTPTPTPVPTPTPTPTPIPAGTVVTDNQTVNAAVAGVLTINAVLPSVEFGTITGGQSSTMPVGQVDYTNTLNDGLSWSVSVKATSLLQGTGGTGKVIPFSNMTFTPGTTVTADSGSSGTPTTGSAGAFGGTDTTPGTTFSNAVTLATAPATTQGAFHQTGSTLQLAVPLTTQAGPYAGTLQYTIIG